MADNNADNTGGSLGGYPVGSSTALQSGQAPARPLTHEQLDGGLDSSIYQDNRGQPGVDGIKGTEKKDPKRWVLATYREQASNIAQNPLPTSVNGYYGNFHADEPMLSPYFVVLNAMNGFTGMFKDNIRKKSKEFREHHHGFDIQELREEFQTNAGVKEFIKLNPDIRVAVTMQR